MKGNGILLLLSLVAITVESKLLYRQVETFDFEAENGGRQENSLYHRNRTRERINFTIPGTKWCGPGNIADGYDDLGSHEDVDRCCRDHDHCDNIPGGETKYGLRNDDHFTRLHCKCDRDFKECLKKVDSAFSNKLGAFYFTVRNKCYKNEHPIVECSEYSNKAFLRRCVRYVLDTSLPEKFQWFELPFYSDTAMGGF